MTSRRKRARDSSAHTSGHSSSESSYDDTVGHLEVAPGYLLNGRYTICSELGVGTFGKVFKCRDAKHGDTVAVKVVRNIERYRESARIEAGILSEVYAAQRRQRTDYIVKMYSSFEQAGHVCLVFEPLGVSLYDFIKRHQHRGFPMRAVLDIAQQLLGGVGFLHDMRLIHTDLKLENVLLSRSESALHTYADGSTCAVPVSTKIKLIDFGGATYDQERKSTCINTRQYRGPEVVLETGWSFPSDIWGVGCMVAETYAGDLLFATHDNLEHLALMERAVGAFPRSAEKSPLYRRYFSADRRVRTGDLSSASRAHVKRMPALESMFRRHYGDSESGIVELMHGLLCLDPCARWTASEALGFLADRPRRR